MVGVAVALVSLLLARPALPALSDWRWVEQGPGQGAGQARGWDRPARAQWSWQDTPAPAPAPSPAPARAWAWREEVGQVPSIQEIFRNRGKIVFHKNVHNINTLGDKYR